MTKNYKHKATIKFIIYIQVPILIQALVSHLLRLHTSAHGEFIDLIDVHSLMTIEHFFKSNKIEAIFTQKLLLALKYVQRYFEKLKFTNGSSERRFIESLLIKKYSPNFNSQVKSKPFEIVF